MHQHVIQVHLSHTNKNFMLNCLIIISNLSTQATMMLHQHHSVIYDSTTNTSPQLYVLNFFHVINDLGNK